MSNTSDFFDKYALEYDKKVKNNYFKDKHKWIIDNVGDLTGKKVLDVGCGTGELCYVLKSIYPNAEYRGIDISEVMIAKSKKRVKDIKFDVGNVQALPYEDNSFDIIVNTLSFHHYEDPQGALNEMKRVLKPGGKIYILDSIKNLRLISIMPWYWDIVDSKECYSKHLFKEEFQKIFKNSGFKNTKFKTYYKVLPVVHLLSSGEK